MRLLLLTVLVFAVALPACAAPPICPHITTWRSDVAQWAVGAPWVKVLSALDCQRAKDQGSKVFYRPYDIPNHDDGGTGDGIGMANNVLTRLSSIPTNKWPDAIGYRNEFGGGDTTTTAQFINYYNRLRAGYNGIPGYTGWIVFGSYSTGVPESYRWSQADMVAAVNLADAIETHEYFDLTEARCHTWLACRHLRFLADNPYLQGKPWFIGEAGSDRIAASSGCQEDACDRRGWRYTNGCGQKLSEAQYIGELTTYRNLCANQIVAVFLFQQGDYNWDDFEIVGTSVANWVKSTWNTAPGALTGNVKNATGQNLEGATITLNPSGASAATNASGNYTISSVAPGGYTATASKSGYNDSVLAVNINSGQTTTQNFTLCPTGTELLSNGGFTSGCTGWSHSESPSNIYWGCGNKAYPGTSAGSGGHSWNAYLSCGGYFCDRSFTGEQHQDNVPVSPGACYTASAQVYYEPVLHSGVAADQKERIVLIFNDGAATHASDWHTHATSNGWDRLSLSGIVPAGMTKVTFKVEVSHTDGQWSGTGAVDECSLQSTVWGTISGYVRDNAGNAISGATVSTNTGGYTTTTAANGSYTLSSVIVGLYNLTAAKSGWQSQVQPNKQVIANSTITVNFNLTDASAPTTPVVTDDGVYTTSTSQLHASWTASDPQTGIAEYQYAIGTSSGATNVVNWTTTGTTPSVTRTGLALSTNSTYYISVKARNADGMWSTAGNSDGIRPARSVPSIRQAKEYPDNECVRVTGRVVSAKYSDSFYVQEPDRTCGIKVTGATAVEGSIVTVTGVLSGSSSERVITQAQVE